MKTAIYTIALNEEAHAERFMQSCDGADYIVIGDTGSTDRTNEIILDHNGSIVPVYVRPWRFDVARNAVMALLPPDVDICIALDLDEIVSSNWRELIDNHWRPGVHDRLEFRYVHDFKPDGSYGTVGMRNHSHSRTNYLWEHIVHEELHYTGPRDQESVLSLTDMVVEHRQDLGKSRSSYLPMLELECEQVNTTPRHMFWLIREYVFQSNWIKVLEWSDRFLATEGRWNVETAHAYRFRAKAYAHLQEPVKALTAHYEAVRHAPLEREVWLDLAWFHSARNEWEQAYGAVIQTMSLKQRPEHYLAGQEAWSYKVYELAALAADHVGIKNKARDHILTAMRLAPDIDHLRQTAKTFGVTI